MPKPSDQPSAQEDLFAASPVAPASVASAPAPSAPTGSIDGDLYEVSNQARSAFIDTLQQVEQLPPGMEQEEQRLLQQMEELMEQTRKFDESRRKYLEGDSEAFAAYLSAAQKSSPEQSEALFSSARSKIQSARNGVVESVQQLARNPLMQNAQKRGNDFIERALESAERMGELDTILLSAAGRFVEKAENKGKEFYQQLRQSFERFCDKAYGPFRALKNNVKEGLTVAGAVLDTASDVIQKAEQKLQPVVARAIDVAQEGIAALGSNFREHYARRKEQEQEAAPEVALPSTGPTAKL